MCHLKDKSKIRHKKRWSQCMYMYYLLGYRLMELPISDARKDVIKENTYLLALDGDIDFQPEAITRLARQEASTETLLLVFLVTLALLLTLATRGRPPCP